MNYNFENKITYADYKALRDSAGWREVSERQFDIGVKNTHYTVAVKHNDKVVAMGKAVGDGGYYWNISDLIVLPEYQGKGLGREINERLLKFINDSAESGEYVVVHLASAKGKEPFYEKFGFKTRPFDNYGAGMSLIYIKE
ncbi:MAG: GNAT family N-acetyltransferase [Oscillospiraceae bacterium]|jgi:GNAT superfamily N-acetyltransferase|nr:GNAT family N-acetyltransferase [Oscillospiraceae bacterium]